MMPNKDTNAAIIVQNADLFADDADSFAVLAAATASLVAASRVSANRFNSIASGVLPT